MFTIGAKLVVTIQTIHAAQANYPLLAQSVESKSFNGSMGRRWSRAYNDEVVPRLQVNGKKEP